MLWTTLRPHMVLFCLQIDRLGAWGGVRELDYRREAKRLLKGSVPVSRRLGVDTSLHKTDDTKARDHMIVTIEITYCTLFNPWFNQVFNYLESFCRFDQKF